MLGRLLYETLQAVQSLKVKQDEGTYTLKLSEAVQPLP